MNSQNLISQRWLVYYHLLCLLFCSASSFFAVVNIYNCNRTTHIILFLKNFFLHNFIFDKIYILFWNSSFLAISLTFLKLNHINTKWSIKMSYFAGNGWSDLFTVSQISSHFFQRGGVGNGRPYYRHILFIYGYCYYFMLCISLRFFILAQWMNGVSVFISSSYVCWFINFSELLDLEGSDEILTHSPSHSTIIFQAF